MFVKYVWADLIRNPRRTLSTAVGVMLGVGLSCAILFFVDGLSASMTQRALAPLPIDMQRVLTAPLAGDVQLALTVEPTGPARRQDLFVPRSKPTRMILPLAAPVRSAVVGGFDGTDEVGVVDGFSRVPVVMRWMG